MALRKESWISQVFLNVLLSTLYLCFEKCYTNKLLLKPYDHMQYDPAWLVYLASSFFGVIMFTSRFFYVYIWILLCLHHMIHDHDHIFNSLLLYSLLILIPCQQYQMHFFLSTELLKGMKRRKKAHEKERSICIETGRWRKTSKTPGKRGGGESGEDREQNQ